MKSLIIYDETGKVWNVVYGETKVPKGILGIVVEIPSGAMVQRVDITDKSNPKVIFTYLPESDIGQLKKNYEDLRVELYTVNIILNEEVQKNKTLQEELNSTQLSLLELYEAGGTV